MNNVRNVETLPRWHEVILARALSTGCNKYILGWAADGFPELEGPISGPEINVVLPTDGTVTF